MAIHEAERTKLLHKGENVIWAWHSPRVVERAFESIWQLLGEWRARRGAPFVSTKRIKEVVVSEVISLAKLFNSKNIDCLRSFKTFSPSTFQRLHYAIMRRVLNISLLKKTIVPQPMLGSKILHHFFPTVVPVYDDLFISKQVMKLSKITTYEKKELASFYLTDSIHQRMNEFQKYHRFCTSQICSIPMHELKIIRREFGEMFADLLPHKLYLDKQSWGLTSRE
ncbi:MAG: hypothetical protein AB1728_13780 [Bacteroidota bacterium]